MNFVFEMELRYNLPFPFNQQTLSPLERDLLSGKQEVLMATVTEIILRDAKCPLYEGHNPNHEVTYAREMFKLGLKLCQKYAPHEVELAMKKYVPDLF